uniref:Uncharacterized protein n=1 Tax=Molossus molossus TaxID=27622 RepID=A0A7J8I0Y3_MOLMO|nr:hypothetical protein HJG59_010831 [Molossus molossus]
MTRRGGGTLGSRPITEDPTVTGAHSPEDLCEERNRRTKIEMRPDMVTTSRESKEPLPVSSIKAAHRNPLKDLPFKMLSPVAPPESILEQAEPSGLAYPKRKKSVWGREGWCPRSSSRVLVAGSRETPAPSCLSRTQLRHVGCLHR